jgi:tetratricopeptide (TPR) repeat protein
MALAGARELAAGRLDAARVMYEKVLAIYPLHLEALESLGVIDVRQGRRKEAAARVESALAAASGNPTADLLLVSAKIQIGAGNADRAEALLRQAIEREPTRLNAYGMLGQLFALQNRLVEAQAQFEALLARDPRSVSAGTMLGMILEARNDRAGAEQQYKRTLAVDPSAAVAANNLAWIYVSTGRNLEEALQLAQTALKKVPEEPHVNDTLGWVYYRKGFYKEAVRHLELSIKRDSSDAAVHYHLGMAYVGVGDREKARHSLERALSMSQSFEGADEARKTLGSLGGK